MAASKKLELLSPARDADTGIAAILHGADAVYIGGPQFGARQAAGNEVSDIARLAEYSHRFGARVYVTLNTLLHDDELETARRIAWQLYDAGADALIIQDMGLLELDLPPLALHASTQTDNRAPEKVRFLEAMGFSQIVLARELSLSQIRAISAQISESSLEFFVHGALCVSYSGQCYFSHASTGRSANRGECAQSCRLPYTLVDRDGQVIARNQHLLSLKDNNQSANLRELADAGIRSFKIEGRLKDTGYVKNITAYYRRCLDQILEETTSYERASSGRCQFLFEPQAEKSFNRGATDYFVHGRRNDIASFATPKFTGEVLGQVLSLRGCGFDIDAVQPLQNGDGLSYFDPSGELRGLRVNRVQGNHIIPAEPAQELLPGTQLYRNRDQDFVRQLEKKSAERRITVHMRFEETDEGFCLHLIDEDGNIASADLVMEKKRAQNPGQVANHLHTNLGKLGNTDFVVAGIELHLSDSWFIPASAQNAVRRQAVSVLQAVRRQAYQRPPRRPVSSSPPPYPEATLDHRGNVLNQKARAFFIRHGVTSVAPAYECNQEEGTISLMTAKHCLRYSFDLCPKQSQGNSPTPMFLLLGKERWMVRFDCQNCEMHVEGQLKKGQRP